MQTLKQLLPLLVLLVAVEKGLFLGRKTALFTNCVLH